MSTQESLPLIDLTPKAQNVANLLMLQHGFRRWGAFRLLAPGIKRAFAQSLPHGREFFQQRQDVKCGTKGYSAFGTERIRGKLAIPKESVYFFRESDQEANLNSPPPDLSQSITEIRDEWRKLRRPLFDALSNEILSSNVTLTGTPVLDYESMGLHYYLPQRMTSREIDYNPPHMDGGTLTILIRGDDDYDGLEIADLESTEKLDGEGIGLEASFLPVPAATDEVIVFFGTRMQRLLGKDKARACVHRVRAPAQLNGQQATARRFSIAIFCAPPVK